MWGLQEVPVPLGWLGAAAVLYFLYCVAAWLAKISATAPIDLKFSPPPCLLNAFIPSDDGGLAWSKQLGFNLDKDTADIYVFFNAEIK